MPKYRKFTQEQCRLVKLGSALIVDSECMVMSSPIVVVGPPGLGSWPSRFNDSFRARPMVQQVIILDSIARVSKLITR